MNNIYALKYKSKGGSIDFINDLLENKNSNLLCEFLSLIDENNPVNLLSWFNSKGYNVTYDECLKIIENKNVITYINNNKPIRNDY